MSIVSGYGYSVMSDALALNLNASAGRVQADVAKLSSGTRIGTAADDPSGLAIAGKLQAKVNGYDQATSNVQTATNALTVADSGLQTITDILQRLRTLAVQANSDLLSDGDRTNIQTESAQLQAEINSIAESTSFNGLHLLNGDPDILPAAPPVADSTFATPATAGQTLGAAGSPWTFSALAGVINYANVAQPAYGAQAPPSGAAQMGMFFSGPDTMSQTITGFADKVNYALSFNMAQIALTPNAETVAVSIDGKQVASYTPIPSNGPANSWTAETSPSFMPGAGTHTVTLTATDPNGFSFGAFIDNVQLTSVSQDWQPTQFDTQQGANEGSVTAVQVPGVTTYDLGISNDTVNSSADAATYETDLDSAIASVGTTRAAMGAQMVSLQYQAANNETASINLADSVSNIRDTDVAQTTTAWTHEQILSSVGTSVLANVKTLAASVEKLFQ